MSISKNQKPLLQRSTHFYNKEAFAWVLSLIDKAGKDNRKVYRNKEVLIKRILMILRDHKEEIKIKEIREFLDITQKELADLTGQR